jgi:hypothetical protein
VLVDLSVAHDEHRASRRVQQAQRDAAQERARDRTLTAGTNDEEVGGA